MTKELSELSLQELTDKYNKIPNVKPVKLFRDKATAIERILKLTQEKTKPDHKPTGNFAKLPEWIAFTSEVDTEYRIRIRTKMVQKYGRPVDMEGKPMIASRTKVEELLASVEK